MKERPMMNTSDVVVGKDCCTTGSCGTGKRFKIFCWSGVVVGALVATGLSFLLGLFNVGIGLAVVNNTPEGVATVVIGSLIGLAIGAVVTMYVAGWIAGYLAKPCGEHHLGALQGFTAWCLALVIALVLVGMHSGVTTLNSQLLANSTNLTPNPTVTVSTNDVGPAVKAVTNAKGQPVAVNVNAEKAANSAGVGALVAFLIFFLGAVASAFGGYCGMCCRAKHCGMDHCSDKDGHVKM